MKLFGFSIDRNSTKDEGVLIRTVKPSTIPISHIPSVKVGSLSYSQQFARGRGVFTSSEYDLAEIGKAEDVDSFLRQAFKKKEGLMFKEGVCIKGKNKDTVRYYTTRMAQIARASNIPEIMLLKSIGRSLIRTSNAFLIKVRKASASGGRARTTPEGKEFEPVAAYFPAAPETMRADIDQATGKVRAWRQILPNGLYRDYSPDDVVHFVIDRREGFLFGIPTVVPVLDDIRALRQIEENIELLLYQHLFPLFHYQVGTESAPAGYTEDGVREVDAVEAQIRLMPSEGALVTPERHQIKNIGAEGQALRAEGYLEHFKKRVFAGLGVSSVDFGDGDTTNRATANTMSRALVDAVKAIQDELEAQWDQMIITELLLESTFGDEVLEEDMIVHLKFAEIDLQNKMDLQSHAVELWKSSGLTYNEFRGELGLEPINVPTDPDDQDMSKYPEWSLTYWKLIEEPIILASTTKNPNSVGAAVMAGSRGAGVTQEVLQKSQQAERIMAQKRAASGLPSNKQRGNVAPQAIDRPQQDNFLATAFSALEYETEKRLLSNIETRGNFDKDYLMSLARTWADNTVNKLNAVIFSEFSKGFNDQTGGRAFEADMLMSLGRSELSRRTSFYINKLTENTINLLTKRLDDNIVNVKLDTSKSDIVNELHISFDTVRYRTRAIWDIETRKAYIYGRVLGMKHTGVYGIKLEAHANGCAQCKAIDHMIIPAATATLDDMPPYHPHSRIQVNIINS